MTKFTNTTRGPKGVNTKTGLVYVDPGATSGDLDVEDGELASAEATGWFDIDGDDDDKGLAGMTVPDLKALAEAEEIDLGDNTKKADIIAAIELAREAKA